MEYLEKKAYQRNGKGQFKKGKTGRTVFSDEYKGLSFEKRHQKAALIASDNKRCWWVYQFVKTPVYSFESKDHIVVDTSNLNN